MGFSKSGQSSNNTSQQTSASSNQAYPSLQRSLGGEVSNVGAGSSAIRALLGLDGSGAQNEGFNKFKDSSGYNFIRDEGVRGIEGSQASKGLLNSGSTLQGITKYSSGLASQFLDKYLSQLQGLSTTGLGAANVIGSAGQTSNSQGTSTGSSQGKSSSFQFGS